MLPTLEDVKKLFYSLKWISILLESGKSASQTRGKRLTQMVSILFVCVSVEKPKICLHAIYLDLEKNSESLLIWRNKDGSRGFYLQKWEWAGSHWQLSGQWNNLFFSHDETQRLFSPILYHIPTNPLQTIKPLPCWSL